MCEGVKRYVNSREMILKSWLMEWTEKDRQYMRDDMELLKEEMRSIMKQANRCHRDGWNTGLEKDHRRMEEEDARGRRKMADQENERRREMDLWSAERARVAICVEDMARQVRELEGRLRERDATGHCQEVRLREMENTNKRLERWMSEREAMFSRQEVQQRQQLEKLEQMLETRAITTKDEYNPFMTEVCQKTQKASGEWQNHENLPATKGPMMRGGESAEMMVRQEEFLREAEKAIKEMEVRMREKDVILQSHEAQYMHRLEQMQDLFELQAGKMKAAYSAQITEAYNEMERAFKEMQKWSCRLAISDLTKRDDETTDDGGQSWATGSGMGSTRSKRRDGKSRKVKERGRPKSRSSTESKEESMRSRRQWRDTSAESDISSIANTEPRSLSEKSLAASDLSDSSLQTCTSSDKTSVCSQVSLAKDLGADVGKEERRKSCGMGSTGSKRRDGKSKKVKESGRPKSRSSAESNEEGTRSTSSHVSLAKDLGADEGKEKRGKSWKRIFGGLFQKKKKE